jgi:transposase InsO family protein
MAKRLKALDRAIARHRFEGIGEGERQAEAPACRANAGHGGDEGSAVKKLVTQSHEPPLVQGHGDIVKREAVAHLQAQFGLSERRACQIAGADRKMVRYPSQRAADTALRGRLRDLANQRRRFGDPLAGNGLDANRERRRLFVRLRREGEASGINRIYRHDREQGLTLRKRKTRRKAIGTRTPILLEARANARWSRDLVHDPFACGRRFRVLNVVDDVTRECLAAVPDTAIPGRRVARELTALIKRRGKPGMIVSDRAIEAPLVQAQWRGERN